MIITLNLVNEKSIGLLGPTASGKTKLAVHLAAEIQGEIISFDSRQVYRGMNIGTGKDLQEYEIQSGKIPYHLIDILDAGEKYNVFDFKRDCLKATEEIVNRANKPIFCGGTGLYFDAVLFDYHLPEVKDDPEFRQQLELKDQDELIEFLRSLKPLHNTTDIQDRERLIRAIEVARAEKEGDRAEKEVVEYKNIFGLRGERNLIKKRIEERLKLRLEEGMINEVQTLLSGGLDYDDLLYYGLEYKFISLYLKGELTYNDMFQKLRSGIFQFSKRQMTWYRRMEKKGIVIHWLEIEAGMEENLSIIKNKINLEN